MKGRVVVVMIFIFFLLIYFLSDLSVVSETNQLASGNKTMNGLGFTRDIVGRLTIFVSLSVMEFGLLPYPIVS